MRLKNNPEEILENYSYATQLDPDWYKAWHTWALANFEVISYLEQSKEPLKSQAFEKHIVPAVQGKAGIRMIGC
jgi:FKBP12-rapamycin complex-associated protein